MNSTLLAIAKTDQNVNTWFRSFSNPRVKYTLSLVTHLGSGAVWTANYACAVIFFKESFSGLVWYLIIAELCGLPIVIVLRYMTKRERPLPHPGSHVLSPWNRYSFPSHHAMRSFMVALLVGLSYRAWLPVLFLVAAIISFSRIYLQRHYLSDVLSGALLGLLLAVVIKMV